MQGIGANLGIHSSWSAIIESFRLIHSYVALDPSVVAKNTYNGSMDTSLAE